MASNRVRLSVSVEDAQLTRFPEVVRACKQAGMKVEEQMEAIGVISGEIDAAKLDDLRRVRGVAHVEEERSFRIAPPESDVQ